MVILTTVAVLFAYAGFASVYHNDHGIAYAQNNQTSSSSSSSSSNQTTAKVTGTPQTTILNKTTIPAQQTTVKVNQTTKPVGQQSLKPLQNLTQQQQQPGNLSGIQNKTMVVPTGKATTTLVNKTTVPFNQTMVKSGSANQTQQQQPGNVTSAAGGSSNSSSGNQTQQQQQKNQTNPLSKVPVIGKLFGGK